MWLSFSSGGYFAGSFSLVAVLMAGVLFLRIELAPRPFEGVGPAAAVAVSALALLAVWTLLSALWSGMPASALLEFTRVLGYTLALFVFASIGRSGPRVQWMLRGLAAAVVLVCGAALLSRLFPDMVPVEAGIAANRLSWPLTYWNALGLVAALGLPTCLHLASSEREPRIVRVLAAGAPPVLATTLLFTFSRGAIVAAAISLAVYLVVGRPRLLVTGLLATVPPTVFALIAAYGADALSSADPTGPAGVAEGRGLAVTLGLAVLVAGIARVALLWPDERLARLWLPAPARRALALGVLGVAAVAAIGLSVALDLPGRAQAQIERVAASDPVQETGDFRGRLTNVSANGRIEHWDVALDAFSERRLAGHGAGTYAALWDLGRPSSFDVTEAHSLYLEVLAELGLVGFALLLVAIGTVLVALAARARGRDRPLHAALLASALGWAVHAGIDWDWEVPALTLAFFCAAGLGLGLPRGAPRGLGSPSTRSRVALGIACLVLAVAPALLYVSQGHLNAAAAALERGDCAAAIDRSLDSSEVLSVRPEPFQVLGYCDIRAGQERLAVRAMENAVRRDPRQWEYRYGLALARGAARIDPRPAAAAAVRLNPRSEVARELARRLDTRRPELWERRARSARLVL